MLREKVDVEDIYKAFEAIHKDARFLAGLTDLVWKKSDEYLEPMVENTCITIRPPPSGSDGSPTTYDTATYEYLMWMNSLVSMAWLLINIKNKTEHGHCHNPIHNESQKQIGYTNCVTGSAYHVRFYENIVSSLEQLLKYANEHRPNTIEKDVSGKKDDTSKGV